MNPSTALQSAIAASPPAPPVPPAPRIRFLDGIRGWAALQVAVYHLVPDFLSVTSPTLMQGWIVRVFDGDLAVYIFFVVSAFALSIGFFETGNRETIETMAIRRYPRLVIPILACSLVVFVLMVTGAIRVHEVAAMLGLVHWPAWGFNFTPTLSHVLEFSLFDVFFRYDPLQAFSTALWTMPVEMYGSAMIFVFLYSFGLSRLRYCLYPVCTAVAWMNDSPFTAFAFGVMLSEAFAALGAKAISERRVVRYGSLACGIVGVMLLLFGGRMYGHPAFLSLCALLLVASIAFNPALARLFEAKISLLLGRLSFPLYLTHIAVIASFSSFAFLALMGLGAPQETAAYITVAVSLPVMLLAAAAFYPAEAFAVRFSRTLSNRVMAWKRARRKPPPAREDQ